MFQVNENEDKNRNFDDQWSERKEVEGSFGDSCDRESEGIDFSKGFHDDGPVMKVREWADNEGGLSV